MKPKPKFLDAEYARQFEDASVAAVYRKRPPYPPETFEIIGGLLPVGNRNVLDLGAGTGEVSIPLAEMVDSVHAVEPSLAMVSIGRNLPGSDDVTWYNTSGELFDYATEYGVIVCAQCLGWMEWETVFPKMVSSLHPDGYLVIVEQSDSLADPRWQGDLHDLIVRYSTNQDVIPFDLMQGIIDRGLFEKRGSEQTAPMSFQQSLEDFVDSIHARNGFSRDRMTESASSEFDHAFVELLRSYHRDGVLRGEVIAQVTWGKPRSPTAG